MKKDEIRTEEDVARFLSHWTEFERKILIATFKIPTGKVSTYKRIAKKVGKPRAYRAVANALHKNPLHPIVPCHRVIRSDGKFGGEKKEAESRKELVAKEGIRIEKDKVKLTDEILY